MCGRPSSAGGQLRGRWFPVGAGRGGVGGGREWTAGGRRGRRLVVVAVLVRRSATRVHEEVGDRRHFESELVGYHRLHLLVGSTSLAEDRQQRPTLDVGEN